MIYKKKCIVTVITLLSKVMLFVTLHCYLLLYKILITNPKDLKEALKLFTTQTTYGGSINRKKVRDEKVGTVSRMPIPLD